MKKFLLAAAICYLFLTPVFTSAQNLQPFENCPGVSVAITRPGINATPGPYQIYLIDSLGAVQPSGAPINLQINGFGLNTKDGFFYGIHESPNVINPFLTRVDKNGSFENVGVLTPPTTSGFKLGIINTAAGTMDDQDNYYLTSIVIDLQNVSAPPELFVGKIQKVSTLTPGSSPITIQYSKINFGTCADELLVALTNPLQGAVQDIAYNTSNGNIYTFIAGAGAAPSSGKIAWFNPNNNPTINCIDPASPNIPTFDLSGLYFSDNTLFMLTIDGKFYKGNIQSGEIQLVGQSGLPLLGGNLRGDMASCVGKKAVVLVPFDNCPGVSVAITRPGINSTVSPFQIYVIDQDGNTQPSGNPINAQFNGFGLNSKDGFLYAMHESSDVVDPFFSRMDKNGNFVDIGKLSPPPNSGSGVGIINTAAGTMDGNDNFYFTAVTGDTPISASNIPTLYLGIIENVSTLKEGDQINIQYRRITIGTCADELLAVLSNPANGLLQDLAFDPNTGHIYTVIPAQASSPGPAKIAYFNSRALYPVLNCVNPQIPNIAISDLSGIFSNDAGRLFILTIDGKFYMGNVHSGVISLIKQTTLPLIGNNLRGDMASCVKADDHGGNSSQATLLIAPNPVTENQITVTINSDVNARVQLQIIGTTGNILQTKSVGLVTGMNQFQLDVSGLAPGGYSLIIRYPSGVIISGRFIRL